MSFILEVGICEFRRNIYLRRYMLEEVLENIKKKGFQKDFELLEISISDGFIRIPLGKISSLALIE